jgi:hypothetical protein
MRLLLAVLLLGCSDGAQPMMSFDRALGFYAAPFPSDDLRRADGTIDVSQFPNPNKVDLIDQGLRLLATDARGFALAGGVFFQITDGLDEKSLPELAATTKKDAAVFLSTVADPTVRHPVSVAFTTDGGPFGARNLLSLLPIQGMPLNPRTQYVAVVTDRVRDRHGRALSPSPTMRALAGGHGRADYVAAARLFPGAVGLAVFTTDDPTAQLAAVRDDALARPLPTITPAVPADSYDDYCVFNASMKMPVYQSGQPPYTKDGGAWLFGSDGKPIFDHDETAHVYFTIPRRPPPPGGFPTMVFVRTGGGGDRPLIERGASKGDHFDMPVVPGTGPARELARVGFAGVQVDGPLGGMRNTTNGDEQFLIFNVFNAAALRDNVRQSALELIVLAHALDGVTVDATTCKGAGGVARLDLSHLAIMGHSMGGWIAPITMAYESRYGAAVLSGAGGSYIANVMDKIEPVKVRPLAEILLDYNMDERSLDPHDPALTLMQWGAEPSDPQVYDGRVSGRHVLMLQGIVDHYILPSIANATSLAMGLDEAGPAYDATSAEEAMLGQTPLATLLPYAAQKAIALPASGNAAGATAVVVQHPGDGIEDGHEVVFQTEPPKHQYRCFLSSWLSGVPTVPPDGAADDPCN